MQTFLPYPDDRLSAAVLDDKRLGKQRVETLQILRALTWSTYGWRNHPAVRMWRGFVPALVAYGAAVCDEWVARGRADAVKPVLLEFTGGVEPSWDRLHAAGLTSAGGCGDAVRNITGCPVAGIAGEELFDAQAVVEEAAEVWMAAEYEGDERTSEEISQLIYHLQVLMVAKGLTPADVWRHL